MDWDQTRVALYIAFAALPVLVMMAWGVFRATQADSIRALSIVFAAKIAFAAMALIPWVIGWAFALTILLWLMGVVGVPGPAHAGALVTVVALDAAVGAFFGWRYLDAEQGTDARQWRL